MRVAQFNQAFEHLHSSIVALPMAPDSGDIEEDDNVEDGLSSKASNGKMQASHQDQSPESEEDQEEEEEEDEEPRLKYASVTKHMKPVYRNGDATSAFLVGGDKMVGRRWHSISDVANHGETQAEGNR